MFSKRVLGRDLHTAVKSVAFSRTCGGAGQMLGVTIDSADLCSVPELLGCVASPGIVI